MSDAQMTTAGKKPIGRASRRMMSKDQAVDHPCIGLKLLAALAEPDTFLREEQDRLMIIRRKGRVSMPVGTMPLEVLPPLLSSGAIMHQKQPDQAQFIITDAGHALLRRSRSGEERFASQHRVLTTRRMPVEGVESEVQVNLKEDPLGMLARQRDRKGMPLIGPAVLAAAARFRRDLALAGTVPQVTANWSRLAVDGSGPQAGLSVPERVIEAQRRVSEALDAVGTDFSGLVLDLCGFYKGIEVIERQHGFPLRAGKVVAAFALRALARHYGMSDEARGPDNRGIIRQWAASDREA